jgi:hypothetical protein
VSIYQDSWVWVPDSTEVFIPYTVKKSFSSGKKGVVKAIDGKVGDC